MIRVRDPKRNVLSRRRTARYQVSDSTPPRLQILAVSDLGKSNEPTDPTYLRTSREPAEPTRNGDFMSQSGIWLSYLSNGIRSQEKAKTEAEVELETTRQELTEAGNESSRYRQQAEELEEANQMLQHNADANEEKWRDEVQDLKQKLADATEQIAEANRTASTNKEECTELKLQLDQARIAVAKAKEEGVRNGGFFVKLTDLQREHLVAQYGHLAEAAGSVTPDRDCVPP